MYANNEIGTIQPITKLSNIIRSFRQEKTIPFFHTDACQAAGALPLKVATLGVDLLTLNGSKIYGPKGVGCLYITNGIQIKPMIIGGEQESYRRAGTENVPFIIGFAHALSLAENMRKKESKRLIKLRDYLLNSIKKSIKQISLNGHQQKRLPNNVNIAIHGIEGEALMLMLDREGIYVSTGSACASHDLNPSHVLLAMGLPAGRAHESVRFTMGRETTKKDLDYVLKVLPVIVSRLRKISITNTWK
jgi:cysteine desulfurase